MADETGQLEISRGKESEFAKIMDFMQSCFATKRPDHDRFETLFCDVYERTAQSMNNILTARAGGRLVGAITVSGIKIVIGHKATEVGAIGGVCTHPDYRGRGIMGSLMSSAINELKQRYPVAWLSGYRDRYLHWGFERVPTTKEYELGVRSPGFKKLVELQNWKIKSVSTDAMDWAGTWALVSKVPYFAACGEDALKKKFLRRSKRKSSVLIASNGLRTGLVYAFDDMSEIFAWAGDHEGVGHILACMLKQNAATANVIVPADGDAYTAVFEKLACDERVISRGNIAIINTEKFFSEFTCFGEAVCRKRLSGQIILNIAAACGFDPELIELCADGNELKVRKVNEISGPQLKLGRADLARLFFSINRLQVSSMLPGYAGWVSELGPVPLYIPPLYNI